MSKKERMALEREEASNSANVFLRLLRRLRKILEAESERSRIVTQVLRSAPRLQVSILKLQYGGAEFYFRRW